VTAAAADFRRRLEPRGAEPPLRLMIVDDSQVARAVLSRMVAAHGGFEVVVQAGTAADALAALRSVAVDIILLDIEMPGQSGLDALPEILRAGGGARVLVVSSLCDHGAEAAVRALALGAADTLPKPGTGSFGGRFAEILAERLRRIGRAAVSAAAHQPPFAPAAGDEGAELRLRAMPDARLGCLAIGASTGGLHAINGFLTALPARIGAPILVTQHLPSLFMPFFARQIAAACGRAAHVVEDGETLVPETIHIAPGDAHLAIERSGGAVRVRLDRRRAPSGCLPSVDPMFETLGLAYGAGGLGVVLSGMGRDGLQGGRTLAAAGGALLAQDRQSSAIWGMPRAVAEAGLASAVLPPAELARLTAKRAEPA
jgi:two-component system, chemotaxis family, protein-glutamate methylesterase/glutaminase